MAFLLPRILIFILLWYFIILHVEMKIKIYWFNSFKRAEKIKFSLSSEDVKRMKRFIGFIFYKEKLLTMVNFSNPWTWVFQVRNRPKYIAKDKRQTKKKSLMCSLGWNTLAYQKDSNLRETKGGTQCERNDFGKSNTIFV